jgi:photosystem II stability/assembly factor-like uncharacterized protein
MKKAHKLSSTILLLSILLVMTAGTNLRSQWVNQPSPSGFNIFSCSFPSALTGYVCGYGNLIMKTTNGGGTWMDISLPGTQDNLETVWFLNENTGFIGSTNDSILYTTNGGASWIRHFYALSDLHRIFFINSTTGWASSTKLYKTTNAGLNWSILSNDPAENFFFINENTGWKTTYSGGGSTVLKTTNGTASWVPIHTTSDFRVVYSVNFINDNTGWVSGYREYIAATTNAGVNWVQQRDMDNSVGLYSLTFLNQSTGWAVGDNGTILSTVNGGVNWQSSSVAGTSRLTKVEFVNQSTGWAVGGFGKIYKTTNGGFVSVQNLSETAGEFSLSQNYPNPFNPSTTIKFSIASAGFVELTVFSSLGQEIKTLVKGRINEGVYSVNFDASGLPSGIYFTRLTYGNEANKQFSDVKPMILVK